MPHRCRPILLTLALLAGLMLPAAPPVRAEEPFLLHGVARYTENGPGAGVDGIATSFLVGGVGGGVVVGRLQSSLGPLLALGALSGNATMSSVSEMINSTVPTDLAGMLPVSGYYHANIKFTLEQQEDGTLGLKEGSVNWDVSNSAQLDGEGTSIVDNFGGAGQYTLDPASDQIRLAFDQSKENLTYTLDIDISHPQPTTGESVWSAAEGALEINLRARDGVTTMGGHSIGQPIPEMVVHDQPYNRGIQYTHTGPLSELTHMETYRNLLDAQVVMDYQIFDECSASVVAPAEDEKLTLATCYQCGLEGTLEAEVVPSEFDNLLRWEMPEFGGKDALYNPESHQGSTVRYWYEGPSPVRNDAFGPKEIRVTFEGGESSCHDPDPRKVRYFFPRDKYNNPDPSGRVPNWFYYWQQTRGGQGHMGAMFHDPACANAYGHYNGWVDVAEANHIYLCDMFDEGDSYSNPVTGKYSTGIDFFATVVLHEWTHLENYHDWWGATGYVDVYDDDGEWLGDANDRDMDFVPDDREAAYGLRAGVKDSLGFGFRDSEYPPYLQMDTWPNGSANSEDWADPGKQSDS